MPDTHGVEADPKSCKGWGALRRGRHSSPGADYFLTICLKRPAAALGTRATTLRCLAAMHDLGAEGCWHVRCATVLPDHLHLVATLGQTVGLSATLRLFKGRLSPVLRQRAASWQKGFYDHCLRPDEDRLPVFLYTFLNPYRKGLIPADQEWPGYYCAQDDWDWFGPLTKESCPEPEWLS